MSDLSRKTFLAGALASAATSLLPLKALAGEPQGATVTLDDLKAFAKVAGVSFTDKELEAILPEVRATLAQTQQARKLPEPPNAIEPPTTFNVGLPSGPRKSSVKANAIKITRPRRDEDVAFLTIPELGHLLRTKQITSLELTNIYLARIEKYSPTLLCIALPLADYARERARKMDAEANAGRWRGPLHGIPFGVKDLLSKAGYPTGWGAAPYKDQKFEEDATVIRKLEEAGAILVAKTSVGALAYNNVWYGGATKNPWNLARGSSGSSAGSGSGLAAGLFAFAIGSETLGSIMSPSNENRVTGLRPTYGRVSRAGAMSLSYTMDKIGPMCRVAEDCALVLHAIHGRDSSDPASVERPFQYSPRKDLKGVTVGVLGVKAADFDKDPVLKILRAKGVELKEATVPPAFPGALSILNAEAGANFDELTLSGRVNELKDSIWPDTFRESRFIPAVEYLQAQRRRTQLMREFQKAIEPFDVIFDSGIGNQSIVQTNLTGNPQVLIPLAPNDRNLSQSRSLIGKLFDEATILAVADVVQRELGEFRKSPKL